MVSITSLEVELSAPVKPSTVTPGRLWRTRLKTGAPSITVDSKRNSTPCWMRHVAQVRVGMRDGTFIRRHYMHAPREGSPDVRDGRFTRGRIQRSQFHRDVRLRGVQKIADGTRGRAELRLRRHAARGDRGAVPRRVDARDAKRKFGVLLAQQPRQRARHIAVSDQGQASHGFVTVFTFGPRREWPAKWRSSPRVRWRGLRRRKARR